MKKLYRYSCDFGRMGSLDGVFVADDTAIEKAIGKSLYFGEVLGKHSEVYCDFSKGDLDEITDDQDFIEKFEKLDCASGYNPLRYLEDEE